MLAVATAAYLAAVFLAADAARLRRARPRAALPRPRARAPGVVAGAIAARRPGRAAFATRTPSTTIWSTGDGLVALIASIARRAAARSRSSGGATTSPRATPPRSPSPRSSPAGRSPRTPIFLPGLTIKQAAAPHDTLVAVVVAVVAGAAILFPSLALLFRLVLGGRLGYGEESASSTRPSKALLSASKPGLLARLSRRLFHRRDRLSDHRRGRLGPCRSVSQRCSRSCPRIPGRRPGGNRKREGLKRQARLAVFGPAALCSCWWRAR